MIKYIGSKRRLVPVLGEIIAETGATTALDLFSGTTRVAQEFKRCGAFVTAVDVARYTEIFAKCYIETDADVIDRAELNEALRHLMSLEGYDGYVTETFCVASRFFQPMNGRRIDAIRDVIEKDYRHSSLYSVLLTSLIEAADRVDSTTGVQMAYVKEWAPRSFKDLELRVPDLIAGSGRALRADACEITPALGHFDVAYLDPPYNQHRYFTNYHIWETIVAWDAPEHYGVACKRIDSRDDATKSIFNMKRRMPLALRDVVASVDAELMVLSYNNESWVTAEELESMCANHGFVETLAFDSKRYVGAQIGIFNPSGEKVGKVSHLRNLEYVVLAGERNLVNRVAGRINGMGNRKQDSLF